MDRFSEVIAESQETVTEEQLKGYMLRHLLKRLSDQEFDQECALRFKGMSAEEIEHELVKDIINGQENI